MTRKCSNYYLHLEEKITAGKKIIANFAYLILTAIRFYQGRFMETNLGQILREKILKYKAKHPKLSSVQLAKRFGLPNATLHRIENLGVEKPSFDQVLKILRGTENI